MLTGDEDLASFSAGLAVHSGIDLPLSYLQQCRTVGAFDEHAVLVGGWAMRRRPPFRYLEALPPDAACLPRLRQMGADGRLTEINALWLTFLGMTTRDSTFFWLRFLGDVRRNAARSVIFGFASSHDGLERPYARSRPTRVYQGPLRSSATLTTHAQGTLELLPRWKFRFIVLLAFPEAVRRLRRNGSRGQKFVATTSDD